MRDARRPGSHPDAAAAEAEDRPDSPSAAARREVSQDVGAVTFGFDGTARTESMRRLASEVPVQVRYGGVPFAVMMMSPDDLEDFAWGFSLTEGVIESGAEMRGVSTLTEAAAIRLEIEVSGARLARHLARRRSLSGRTSCGLCGVEDLEALPRAALPLGPAPRVDLGAIGRALAALDGAQHLNRATRAVHAAAFAEADGSLATVREDVGRHNALDKLIGACLRSGTDPREGFVLVTSRASYEMVEKCAAFGCRTLVAISAPTALAVDRARSLDLTLVAIARRDSFTVFHGVDRIVRQDEAARAGE